MNNEQARFWAAFASAALTGYRSSENPEISVADSKEAAAYAAREADALMAELLKRFKIK